MKRAGFTMIELIFVIVILGILAAVALPKFIGVSEQAKVGKLQAYVGTLNRTVLPPYWSDSVLNGNSGSIDTAAYSTKINNDLTAPDGITMNFENINGQSENFENNATVGTAVGSKAYNGVTYSVFCNDGNTTAAARCDLWNGTKWMLTENF
nr:type II secretion system protein [uncultured Sulfurimonas sp.]